MKESENGSDVRGLAWLARELGRVERDWAILAEGNVSAKLDDSTTYVKASGTRMTCATEQDMVEIDLAGLLSLVDEPESTDDDVAALFDSIGRVSKGSRPSVESLLHAVCLDQPGVRVVGHTHPVEVNALLCSIQPELLIGGSLFPDQIVVLGTRPLLIPYVDPGLRLAQEVRRRLLGTQEVPRVIYLENHGMFALGGNASEVVQITEMAVKVARVILGSLAAGGPRFMGPADVTRIDSRPDELLRRAALTAPGRRG